jgi:hypothetical protein
MAAIFYAIRTNILHAGPLVIWLTKGKENAFVEGEAKEALNFKITMTIGFVVCWLLAFILIGFFLVMILGIVSLVLVFIATISIWNPGRRITKVSIDDSTRRIVFDFSYLLSKYRSWLEKPVRGCVFKP